MSKVVAVVVQTHWDREWYFPHQTFLARLLRVMQQVVEQLDNGQLKSFLFDGQVSAIEDFYAHAEPQLVERVRAYVQAGRIVIGPWYIMADEFLCAGESLVRNLELGMARAAQHGRCQPVGYLPDTFGHIGQMPQILRGFGIDNAVAWRGIDAPQSEIDWVAPDGSRVLTVFLTEGYYQHPFNTAGWQDALNVYLDKIVNRSGGSELLLTQGGDHLLTVEDLQQKIDDYNGQQGDFRLIQRSLEEYIRAVQDNVTEAVLPAVMGELRDNQASFVLPDVLSTRQYLKQQNQLLEDRFIGLVEPLLAITAPTLAASQAYPQKYIEQTWQLLIEQHAHDSICGCSVDEVHREMEVRFTQLHQRLDALTQQAQRALGMCNDRVSFHRDHRAPSPFADDSRFTLFNPSVKSRAGWQVIELFLSGEAHGDITVATNKGDALPSVLIHHEAAEEFQSPVDDFPDMTEGHRYTLAVYATLAGTQMLACEATGIEREHRQSIAGEIASSPAPITKVSSPKAPSAKSSSTESASIENSYYRMSLHERELTIEDLRTGRIYNDALSVVSETDGGDTYNFSPVGDRQYRAEFLSGHATTNNSMCGAHSVQTLTVALRLLQPAGLDSERNVTEEMVESTGVLRLRLMPEDAYIDAQLDWDNRARDQRLRLQLSLGEEVEQSAADSAYEWVRRDKTYSDTTQVSGQQESPVAVFPTYSAVSAGPVGFVHRGLQEAELMCAEGEDRLAITLIRSVGWLSRRDLKTRGLGAGPDLPTPEAQCLRAHQFHFAFSLQGPEADALLDRADGWRKPASLLRGITDTQLPQLQMSPTPLQVSSLRRVEWHGSATDHVAGVVAWELRVWNPLSHTVTAAFNCDHFTRVDLAGNPLDKIADEPTKVAPHQIATFIFPQARLPNIDVTAERQHG